MEYKKYYSSFFLQQNQFTERQYFQQGLSLKTFLTPVLPQDKNAKFLEIGCGVGFTLFFLKQQGYTNYFGIDISSEAIEICRQHVTQNVECIDALLFLREKEKINEKFDMIFVFDTLEHFEKHEIIEIMQLSYSLLAANGKLVIKVGNMANLTANHLAYQDFTHKTGFTEESLKYLYSLAGFGECNILEQQPKRFISKIKKALERKLHEVFYWLSRASVPKVTTRKIVMVGIK